MAYDYIDDNKKTGKGTKTRINALLKEMRKNRENIYFFVSTAGFTEKSPSRQTVEVKTSLADQMYQYVKHIKEIDGNFISPKAFGTRNEILSNIELIKSINDGNSANIWISTNWIHIPRVWLCTKFLAPKNFKIRLISCHHPFGGVKEYIKEIYKFFVYFKRFVFREWPS